MSPKTNKAIKTLKVLLAKLRGKINIEKAYLFGSYAYGTPGSFSDIDVALISSQFKGIRFYDYKMLIPLLRDTPSNIEIHPFKPKDFTVQDLFVKEIISKGIKIL